MNDLDLHIQDRNKQYQANGTKPMKEDNGDGRPQFTPVDLQNGDLRLKRNKTSIFSSIFQALSRRRTLFAWKRKSPSRSVRKKSVKQRTWTEAEVEVEEEPAQVTVTTASSLNDNNKDLDSVVDAEESPFDRRIRIEDADGKLVHAIALLDTQCRVGNWISKRLVKRLHKERDISQNYPPPCIQDVNGQAVISCGTITLEWMFHPDGLKIHECSFHVFSDSAHLDVVIGRQYISDECLLEAPMEVLAVLTEHKRQPTDADKAKTAARQEEQRRRKAALEARRQQQGNNQSGSSQSTAAAAPRSQQQQADK